MVHTCHRNPFKRDIGKVIFGKYFLRPRGQNLDVRSIYITLPSYSSNSSIVRAHINYNGTIVPREGQANINACSIANYPRVNTGRSSGLWNRGW